jgi:hypothetical protein
MALKLGDIVIWAKDTTSLYRISGIHYMPRKGKMISLSTLGFGIKHMKVPATDVITDIPSNMHESLNDYLRKEYALIEKVQMRFYNKMRKIHKLQNALESKQPKHSYDD